MRDDFSLNEDLETSKLYQDKSHLQDMINVLGDDESNYTEPAVENDNLSWGSDYNFLRTQFAKQIEIEDRLP